MKDHKQITLRHLLIQDQKMIGIQYYTDKVINALVKELPNPKWSRKHNMVFIENNQKNLTALFEKFKGVAWVNTHYFFINRPINRGNQPLDISDFRKRKPKKGWRHRPTGISTLFTFFLTFKILFNHHD